MLVKARISAGFSMVNMAYFLTIDDLAYILPRPGFPSRREYFI